MDHSQEFSPNQGFTGAQQTYYQSTNNVHPNPRLNSDPTCIVTRSLSSFRFLGSASRLGAGVAG